MTKVNDDNVIGIKSEEFDTDSEDSDDSYDQNDLSLPHLPNQNDTTY